MAILRKRGSSEKVTIKKVKNFICKNQRMIPSFGLFVTVKDRATHQIHMADFIDHYSSSKRTLDTLIDNLYRIDPCQMQDIMDDIKRGRELDEMGLLLAESGPEKP